jgi:hypothetical protein
LSISERYTVRPYQASVNVTVPLDLINRADRSHYEEYDRALMTDAEYALFEHIDGEHRRLSARTG